MDNLGYYPPAGSPRGTGFQPGWLSGEPRSAVASGGGDEGADPSEDLKKQNPDETTTPDLAETERGGDSKVQDLAKAGRRDFDPNDEPPA